MIFINSVVSITSFVCACFIQASSLSKLVYTSIICLRLFYPSLSIQASSLSKLVNPRIVYLQKIAVKGLSLLHLILQFFSFPAAKIVKKTVNTTFFFRFYAKHKIYLTIERQATNLQPPAPPSAASPSPSERGVKSS